MARSTRDTLAWGREAIVSLTQTEIMLVLAVVILLLLLAKNVDLAAAEADVEAVRQLNAALEERTEATQEEILEQKTQADLAREVKDVLVRGGSGPPPDSAAPNLQPGDVATIEEAIRQQTAEQQAVDEALQRAGVVDQGRPKANRIEELGAEAGLAKVLRESLSPARRRELQEAVERDRSAAGRDASQRVESGVSDSEQLGTSEADEGRDDEAVKRLLAEWLHDSPTREERGGSGDQVGFDPCWPGPGGPQERRYYIAFDITYQDKRFLVTPHPDWRAGVATVDRALSGPLAVLREHPRGWTTRERLHEFGRRVEEALKPMRTRGEYVDECLLVTTLNEEASGAVAKFLRVTVGLYPITRDTKRTWVARGTSRQMLGTHEERPGRQAKRCIARVAQPRSNVQVSAPVETSRARVKQRLEREGWFLARHGSAHDIYRHADIEGILTLPRHRRLSPAVARSVAKKAGWSEEERR